MLKNLFSVFLVFVSITSFSQQNSLLKDAKKIEEIYNYINYMYVDDVNSKEVTEAAIVAALEKLDPHSVYISKEDVDDANQQINGNFVGVGIRFQLLKDTLIVVATIPGGPSEKVGLRAGDKIIMVGGENIANVKLKNSQVREKLMGELGTKVKVLVLRKGEPNNLSFEITRDKIPVYSVDCHYMITPETGYLKLNSFSHTTTDEIKASLADLRKKGMKNLILDLQDNGGGLMYAAKTVSDEFLTKDKLVVYSQGKHQPRQDMNCDAKGEFEKGKLLVLVNENSASASEIVSGAIQDWDRGLVVGRRTYGKGLVQRPIDLSDGSQIRLTIARYYTPSGRNIQKPYEGNSEEYHNDVLKRLKHGELMNQDSIKFPDSLKYKTLVKQRTVYGGGGIMPDVFVPLDTTEFTKYFRAILGTGAFNTFSLTYVNKNREKFKANYPTFETYVAKFNCDQAFMDEFFQYIAKEHPTLKLEEKEYPESEKLVKLFLKAMVAQDYWGNTEFYKIYNERNAILQAALKTLKNGSYEKAGLE
jgi:carboxyl-terminal processing protease